jgi:hypothetical protein
MTKVECAPAPRELPWKDIAYLWVISGIEAVMSIQWLATRPEAAVASAA